MEGSFAQYKVAAEQGDPNGWYNLGKAYSSGNGVEPNEDKGRVRNRLFIFYAHT